jgi:multidrug transporter EmrE-like cation transporter
MKNASVLGFFYLGLTIIFTVYGQVILKWRLTLKGPVPADFWQVILFLLSTLRDPYILSTYLAALIASFTWMATLTKFEISVAYPFMSLAFVLVQIIGFLWFGEVFSFSKMLGLVFIIIGLFILVQ